MAIGKFARYFLMTGALVWAFPGGSLNLDYRAGGGRSMFFGAYTDSPATPL